MSTDADSDDDATTRIPYARYAPAGGTWGWRWGWPPVSRDVADESSAVDAPADVDGSSSSWDDGLISLFLVCGVLLFLFPEPTTSLLGIGLIVVGVLAWSIDALV